MRMARDKIKASTCLTSEELEEEFDFWCQFAGPYRMTSELILAEEF